MSLQDRNDTLHVTLTGVFLSFRAALPKMGIGRRLIAIASTASLLGGATLAAYSAAKHGVLGTGALHRQGSRQTTRSIEASLRE